MKLNLLYISASSALLASAANAASISKRDLELQENQCNFVDSRFFITPAKVSGDTAASYCSSLGGRLADVTQQNSMDLNAIVSKCLGPEKSVRIQTWDTNSFGTNHLAMTNGFQASAGSVNVAAETEELYALCQMVDSEGALTAKAEVAAPAEVEAEVSPEAVQAEVVPEAVEAQVVLEAVEAEVVPEAVQAEVVPEAVEAEVAPESVEAQVVPEAVEAEVVPESIQAEVVPEAVEAQVVPEAVEAEVVPEAVQAEVVPEAVQAEVVPEAVKAEVVPAEESGNTLAAPALQEKIQIPNMDLALDNNVAGSLDSNLPAN